MQSFKLAAILTVRNRRDVSTRCVRSLVEQSGEFILGRVVVVDDKSSDGTADSLRQISPRVSVIDGSGDLYWAGGMARAEREVINDEIDAILWVNDDANLNDTAISDLVTALRSQCDPRAI